MDFLELTKDILPCVLSIVATLVAFIKGRTKTIKSVEEIKEAADKRYARYVEKQCKKNKIDNVLIETSNNNEEIEV